MGISRSLSRPIGAVDICPGPDEPLGDVQLVEEEGFGTDEGVVQWRQASDVRLVDVRASPDQQFRDREVAVDARPVQRSLTVDVGPVTPDCLYQSLL